MNGIGLVSRKAGGNLIKNVSARNDINYLLSKEGIA